MTGRLYVVCGEPGVGKSRVARYIADRTDGTRLSADEIRKDLFGPEPTYDRDESQAVYDEMFDRAGNLLEDGEIVVLDATFMLASGRERANRLAQKHTHPYDFELVRVTCNPHTAKKRIDADVSVYQSIRDRFEPIELPHTEVNNSNWWHHTKQEIRNAGLYKLPSYFK